MYLMECALGQFSQSSPLTSWKLSPVGQGVGYGMIVISLIVAIYYNVIIGKCTKNMYVQFLYIHTV
jgi:solute carrier family 6 amino acid transporter-like protein 5/7/9/14